MKPRVTWFGSVGVLLACWVFADELWRLTHVSYGLVWTIATGQTAAIALVLAWSVTGRNARSAAIRAGGGYLLVAVLSAVLDQLWILRLNRGIDDAGYNTDAVGGGRWWDWALAGPSPPDAGGYQYVYEYVVDFNIPRMAVGLIVAAALAGWAALIRTGGPLDRRPNWLRPVLAAVPVLVCAALALADRSWAATVVAAVAGVWVARAASRPRRDIGIMVPAPTDPGRA